MFILDICSDLTPIIKIIQTVVRAVCILVPIVLIVYAIMDLGKAVVASKDDEIKSATNRLIKRVIYGLLIFLVPWLVGLVLGIVADSGAASQDPDTGINCWNQVWNE